MKLHNILRAVRCSVSFIILLCTMACGHSPNTDNARAVKIAVLADIKDDSVADINNTYALIDSLPLASDDDCHTFYMAVNRLTYDMHEQGDDARAVTMMRKIVEILQNSGNRSVTDTRQLLNMYVRLGATFADMGMAALSVDYYLRGLNFCQDSIYDNYKAMFYNNLGIIYAQREMPERAEEYFRNALAINLRKKSHNESFLNYGNLTELYALQGFTEKALKTSQRSLDYADQQNHPEHLARVRVQQGSLYAKLNQPDVAMIRYNTALKQYSDLGNQPGVVDALLHIAGLWLKEQQPDSAIIYSKRALEVCRRHERDDDMAATLKSLSDIYRAKGEYRESLELLSDMSALRDSLHNAESRLRLTSWSDDNSHSTTVEPPLDTRATVWLIIAVVGLLGALALMLTFWQKYRHESRDKIRKATIEKDRLTKELDQLQRQMTSLSLEKLKLHEGLGDVSDCLRTVLTELSPRESEKRETLRGLLGRVNKMASFDADEEFKLFFERIHPEFHNTLNARFPDLTPRDIRLCAFLYLGMTTKEIAVLTYREVRSVDSARNRLRKKLGLELTDDLTAYLHSLG